MPDMQTYSGGCHCGQVRYQVTTNLDPVMSCNCSICRKRGYLLTFVPRAQFELLSGEDSQTDYQFNKKAVHHLFCTNCGIASFGTGTGPDQSEMVAINVRCLEDVDLDRLAITSFDGKSL